MGNAAGFYSSLFAVEFTVLGILIAGVFLFLQIVYQDRLYRFLKGLPRGRLVGAGTLSLVSLGITAAGALLTAFPNHNFIPYYNLKSANYVLSPWFAFLVLALFFISTIFTIWVAITEILSLQPSGLIARASKHVKVSAVRNFLIKEYGIRRPVHFRVVVHSITGEHEKGISGEQKDPAMLDEEDGLYEKLVADVQASHDPLEPVGEIAVRAIQQRDGLLLERALDVFADTFEKGEGILVEVPPAAKWSPNDELADHLIMYVLRWVSLLIRECKRGVAGELLVKTCQLTGKLASGALDRKNRLQAIRIISFWKLEADNLASSDIAAYDLLIESLQATGKRVFAKQDENFEKQVTAEIFRSFGWLVERLINKHGIELKPVMFDTDYKVPYEILVNALMSFSWDYTREGARFYPLIFFDAVWGLFNALLREIEKSDDEWKRQKIYEVIFDCAFAYSEFAESAILVGNGRAASLATRRLAELQELLAGGSDVPEIEKLRRGVIGLMIKLALVATGCNSESISAEFLREGIDRFLFETLARIPDSYSSTFDREVLEAFIKGDKHQDHSAVVAFVKKLSQARNSTFGLDL